MNAEEFERAQREREYFHRLTVLPGAWTVLRLDGRGFSGFTQKQFDKPFDARFSDLMVATTETLLNELGAQYATPKAMRYLCCCTAVSTCSAAAWIAMSTMANR